MEHAKRKWLPAMLALALVTATPTALAQRIGQLGGVDAEERAVVIDGRRYALADDAELGYAEHPNRLVTLEQLRPGTLVKYEVTAGEGGERRVGRLIVLTEE